MTEDERQKLLGTVVEAHGGLSEVTFKLRRELTPKAPAAQAAVRTNDPEGKRGIVGNVRPIDSRQSREPSKFSRVPRRVVMGLLRAEVVMLPQFADHPLHPLLRPWADNFQTFKSSKVYIPQHSDFWYYRRQ